MFLLPCDIKSNDDIADFSCSFIAFLDSKQHVDYQVLFMIFYTLASISFVKNVKLNGYVADYGVDKYDIGTGFGHFAIATPDVSPLLLLFSRCRCGAVVHFHFIFLPVGVQIC